MKRGDTFCYKNDVKFRARYFSNIDVSEDDLWNIQNCVDVKQNRHLVLFEQKENVLEYVPALLIEKQLNFAEPEKVKD